MRKKQILALAGIAGSLFWGAIADAATVSIGISASGTPVAVSAFGTDSAIFSGSLGVFNIVLATGLSSPTDALNSNANNTISSTSSSGGSMEVWVTAQGLTQSAPGFLSSFTTNHLPAGWTVLEQSYLDIGDTLWGTAQLLGSHTFIGPLAVDTALATAIFSAGPAAYSITERYTITATGPGAENSTINVEATPIPAALPLFASGLGALGLLGWRRKRKVAAFAAA